MKRRYAVQIVDIESGQIAASVGTFRADLDELRARLQTMLPVANIARDVVNLFREARAVGAALGGSKTRKPRRRR